jgi:hypothetical protein
MAAVADAADALVGVAEPLDPRGPLFEEDSPYFQQRAHESLEVIKNLSSSIKELIKVGRVVTRKPPMRPEWSS